MTQTSLLSADDLFILGNIGSAAVSAGRGDEALNIMRVLQHERPDHAGGFLMEAMHLSSKDDVPGAIDVLENSAAFDAEINRDEALALHLVLLQTDGQYDRALDLGHAYLATDHVFSESARQSVLTVVEEIEAALAPPARSGT